MSPTSSGRTIWPVPGWVEADEVAFVVDDDELFVDVTLEVEPRVEDEAALLVEGLVVEEGGWRKVEVRDALLAVVV
ncbi:MAG TPA: hypothetical protein VND40_02425 [Nitrososphaerales archaeon]|nr:hypothetical protein [Nitrososphaerales archaeon]